MNKTLYLTSASVLTLLVCIAIITSASASFSVSPSTLSFSISDNSEAFTITNTNSSELLNVTLQLPTINGIQFSTSGSITDINTSSSITVTPTTTINYSNFNFGETYTGNLVVTDASNSSNTETITVEIKNTEFCDYADNGDLNVKIEDITNKGIGEDDKWYPLDNVEIEVTIENDGDDDIDDITLEWGLYSEDDDKWVIELTDEDDFNLKDGDEETITFIIDLDKDLDVDLDELDDGDYTLYIRATGEVDDGNSTDTCESDTESLEIIVEKNYVIADDIKITGTTFCGSTAQLTADIVNIGTDDQEDILVFVSNSDLGISEQVDMGDIDAFEDKTLNYEFVIPEGLDEKIYYLKLEIFDEDNDLYENSDDDESVFTISVDVNGNCEQIIEATVLASLESGGEAGEEMQIRATVTNSGSEKETFTIEIADYTTWAELVEISPETVTLSAGESRDVIVTFNVDEDASEKQTFNILLKNEDENTITQPISATIESGFTLSGSIGDNAYLWGIAIANIILVVVIVAVAVKAIKK